MKRIISLVLSIIMLVCAITSAAPAFATENRKSTAIEIYTDTVNKCLFAVGDSTMWYKFSVPNSTWYTFEILNPYYSNEDQSFHTFLTAYDDEGKEIAFGYTNEFTEKCVANAFCEQGKTYYIELDNFAKDNESYTVDLTIALHQHNLSVYQYLAEVDEYAFYSGYYSETCDICNYDLYYSIPAVKAITLSAKSYVYDNKNHKPAVKISTTEGKALATSNYTVSYPKDVKSVGSHKITVYFKNLYKGSRTLAYTILPKGTSLSKLTATKGGFKATWKKQKTQTTGYQIQYSTSSNFKSAKTVTVSKNATTSKTVSKLKKGKKYYVRIRTYKKVGKTNYYSSWSKAKSVKTKK